ncbi:MAG: YbaB/EbfC family nucleoid-associated protein [Candidatus Hydrogenedentota bacterium]
MLPKGLGGLGDMAGLMKQAMEIRSNMDEIKEQLANEVVEADAGGGMVRVKFNGKLELISLEIDPDIDTSDDREMLETLIAAAVNEGLRKTQDLLKNKMSELTGGMDIPGLTS